MKQIDVGQMIVVYTFKDINDIPIEDRTMKEGFKREWIGRLDWNLHDFDVNPGDKLLSEYAGSGFIEYKSKYYPLSAFKRIEIIRSPLYKEVY